MSGVISHQAVEDWLESQIELAARTMSQELGGDSVCTIHKDGRVTGGLKYQEGRMSALAEVRRRLRQTLSFGQAIDEAEASWLAEFERRKSSQPPSPLWASYATGGLDAVREARNSIEASAVSGHSDSQVPFEN